MPSHSFGWAFRHSSSAWNQLGVTWAKLPGDGRGYERTAILALLTRGNEQEDTNTSLRGGANASLSGDTNTLFLWETNKSLRGGPDTSLPWDTNTLREKTNTSLRGGTNTSLPGDTNTLLQEDPNTSLPGDTCTLFRGETNTLLHLLW